MASTMVINDKDFETRVAIIEDNKLVELHIERTGDSVVTGNVYRGLVTKVLPGMQAAFIDIGLDKAAFLYAGDILPPEEMEGDFSRNKNDINISELVKEGQEIIVQITREAIGTKGPRVTTNITLPGRYLVLMPQTPNIGVSRKIEDGEERNRLKGIIKAYLAKGNLGLIARTASYGVPEKFLRKDYEFLAKLWREIGKKTKQRKQKGAVHSDLDISVRVVRDLMPDDVEKIVVDNRETYKNLVNYLGNYGVKTRRLLEFYDGEEPIFDNYGIEQEISRALEKKVWLKSGGYLVIDEAEALVAIDVNTGKYVGKKNVEETILNTNLEAIKEIATQIRLRNLGGIIILDFIDMDVQSHREKVVHVLKDALKNDKAKTTVESISSLGLVEMTRKRTKVSLSKALCEACPYCEGRGINKSCEHIVHGLFREIERDLRDRAVSKITIQVNPYILDYLHKNKKSYIFSLEKKNRKRIVFEEDTSFHQEQYEISVEFKK